MKLLVHSLIYFLGRILPACIGVCGVALYTRLLDPATVGTYAVLVSIAAFSSVGFNWLRVATFRTLGSAATLEPDFIRTVVVLFFRTSLVVAALEGVGLFAANRSFSVAAIALAIAVAVGSAWFELNITVLQARGNVVGYGLVNLGRAIATLGFSLLFIAMGFKSEALLGGFLLGNATALAASSSWLPAVRGSYDRALSWRMFHFGWPATVTGSLAQFSVTFDRILLGVASGAAAVGIYAVAFDFSRQTVFLLIASTALAGQPLAIKMLDLEGVAAAHRQLRQNARLIFAVALPSVAALATLAGPISTVVLGARFRADAGFVIGMIAFATALYGVRMFYFDQAFELARSTRPQAVISVAAAGFAAICSIILIPRFGAIGAAYSSITSNSIGILASAVWGRRTFIMPIPLRSWFVTGVATAAMTLVLRRCPSQPGLSGLGVDVVVGALTYGAIFITGMACYRAMRGFITSLRKWRHAG